MVDFTLLASPFTSRATPASEPDDDLLLLPALPLPLRPASDNTAGEAAPADPADLLAAGVATHLVSDEQIAELLTELLPAAAELQEREAEQERQIDDALHAQHGDITVRAPRATTAANRRTTTTTDTEHDPYGTV